MKILLLNWQDRLNPHAGGAEIHLHEVFGRLAQAGHDVSMLVSGWRGALEQEVVDGIRVTRVGGRHSYPFLVSSRYRRGLEGGPFDVVVEALNKIPVFSPRWADAPVVLLVHHLFGATAFREASPPVAAATWLAERPIPRVYRDVPVQAISRSTRDDLVSRGLRADRIRVIHPGVDLDRLTPDPAVRAADPTFVYLGRLRRYKGVQHLIQAVSILRDRAVHVSLVIAGQGGYAHRLERLAHRLGVTDRVHFEGFVSEDRKVELFRQAWANLFPSPKEGWGITNLEAGACGTASVASDVPGLRETVVDGRTGILVPPASPDAFAEAMSTLARDRGRADSLGVAARRHAGAFTWEDAARETDAHLQRVMAAVSAGSPG